jgi:hypothetical protein
MLAVRGSNRHRPNNFRPGCGRYRTADVCAFPTGNQCPRPSPALHAGALAAICRMRWIPYESLPQLRDLVCVNQAMAARRRVRAGVQASTRAAALPGCIGKGSAARQPMAGFGGRAPAPGQLVICATRSAWLNIFSIADLISSGVFAV